MSHEIEIRRSRRSPVQPGPALAAILWLVLILIPAVVEAQAERAARGTAVGVSTNNSEAQDPSALNPTLRSEVRTAGPQYRWPRRLPGREPCPPFPATNCRAPPPALFETGDWARAVPPGEHCPLSPGARGVPALRARPPRAAGKMMSGRLLWPRSKPVRLETAGRRSWCRSKVLGRRRW